MPRLQTRIVSVDSIKPAITVVLTTLCLMGCAGKDTILPQDGETMMDVYERHTGSMGGSDVGRERNALRRPLTDAEVEAPLNFDPSPSNQYRRLENPDLVMYVYPHRGVDGVPIPGYTTQFPMYEQVHYALPSEPTE